MFQQRRLHRTVELGAEGGPGFVLPARRPRTSSPDFAGIARAAGLPIRRLVEKPGELEDALRAAFSHDGTSALMRRIRAPACHELSLPPAIHGGREKLRGAAWMRPHPAESEETG